MSAAPARAGSAAPPDRSCAHASAAPAPTASTRARRPPPSTGPTAPSRRVPPPRWPGGRLGRSCRYRARPPPGRPDPRPPTPPRAPGRATPARARGRRRAGAVPGRRRCGDGARGRRERGVVFEDGSLKRLQLGARLEAQLVHEGSPRLTVSLQRLGLATRAIEREHELTPRALPQRLLRDERSRVADDLVVVTRGKLEVDAILDRRGSRLLQAADLRLGDRFQRHVGQRRPAPQRQGLGENRAACGSRRPPGRDGRTPPAA